MVYMPNTPTGNNEIKHVEGNPSVIADRGREITKLGAQMRNSSEVLRQIEQDAIESGGQKGKAIESLRDSIGDSWEKLGDAADLYEPVGPVVETYGEALDDVQKPLNDSADRCEELWSTYFHLTPVGASHEPRAGGLFGPDEGTPEAEAEAQEDQKKKQAYEDWKDETEVFDGHFDTWEQAFEDATQGVTDGTSGEIKDSIWSSFADALGWVAFALAIVAMVFGGPILAAIALAAAFAYLFVVCMQYANDEASGTDIAMAALGIIPLGKATTFTKLAHLNKLSAKSALLSKFTALKGLTKAPKLVNKGSLVATYRNLGKGAVFRQLLTGNARGFRGVYRTHKGFWPGLGNAGIRNGNAVRNLATIDFTLGMGSNLAGHYGRLEKIGLVPPNPYSAVTGKL